MKRKAVRKLLTEDEVEVAQILLDLPKLFKKEELINRYTFTWGRKKKRSVPPEKTTTAAAVAEAGKSPSTPLCFDAGDRRISPLMKAFKRKARDDLMEMHNRMHQERDDLMKNVKAMRTLHQELSYENMELKAKRQKLNYPRNMEEDIHMWNTPMKTSQQQCHQQITMFTPPTPQQNCLQQLLVDPNNSKLVGVAKSNSNGGGRFGLLNQIDPHVNMHMETYEPFDQSWLVMDNVLRVKNGAASAAARKRRMLRMKENKSSLLVLKPSRNRK